MSDLVTLEAWDKPREDEPLPGATPPGPQPADIAMSEVVRQALTAPAGSFWDTARRLATEPPGADAEPPDGLPESQRPPVEWTKL